jgi:hypothetical protein
MPRSAQNGKLYPDENGIAALVRLVRSLVWVHLRGCYTEGVQSIRDNTKTSLMRMAIKPPHSHKCETPKGSK